MDPAGKLIILERLREVLQKLLSINHPELPLYILPPFLPFSIYNCKLTNIQFASEAIQFKVNLKDEFWTLSCLLNGEKLEEFTEYMPLFLKKEADLYLLSIADEDIVRLFKNGDVMLHQQETVAFFDRIINPLLHKYPIKFEEGIKMETQEVIGKPMIYLSELNESFLMIRPKWKYGEFEAEMDGKEETLFTFQQNVVRVVRNPAAEAEFIETLKGLHPQFSIQNGKEYFYVPFKDALAKNWFI